jgi:hypothetical protein
VDGDTDDRSAYGCGDLSPQNSASKSASSNNASKNSVAAQQNNSLANDKLDNSTCHNLGIDTMEQYIKAAPDPGKDASCSFSGQEPARFSSALEVIRCYLAGSNCSIKSQSSGNNELLLNSDAPYWDNKDPSKDHIQALWYNPNAKKLDPKAPGLIGLAAAQSEQNTYYAASKQWVPIVQIDATKPDAPFVYSEQDQVIHQP